MYYAMGYQEEDFVKPMVGVANGHSTITRVIVVYRN
jgi:dihydroxy-acid dehydratase